MGGGGARRSHVLDLDTSRIHRVLDDRGLVGVFASTPSPLPFSGRLLKRQHAEAFTWECIGHQSANAACAHTRSPYVHEGRFLYTYLQACASYA
jgi:hypothetical protein